jgi:hypothetical protein
VSDSVRELVSKEGMRKGRRKEGMREITNKQVNKWKHDHMNG